MQKYRLRNMHPRKVGAEKDEYQQQPFKTSYSSTIADQFLFVDFLMFVYGNLADPLTIEQGIDRGAFFI
jgi:hypothetical protein